MSDSFSFSMLTVFPLPLTSMSAGKSFYLVGHTDAHMHAHPTMHGKPPFTCFRDFLFVFVFQQFDCAISWCGYLYIIFVLFGFCWASWKCTLKFSIEFGKWPCYFFKYLFSFGVFHHKHVGVLDVFWGSVHFSLVLFLSVHQIR